MTWRVSTGTVAVLFLLTHLVLADPVYYAGFGGGVGDWAETNGTDAGVAHDPIGLSFGSLQTTPGALIVTKPSSGEAKIRDTVGTADPLGTTRPESYWLSFLMETPAGQATGDAFWTSDGAWDKGAAGLQGGTGIRFVNGGASSIDGTDGNTHLIVVQISRADVPANNTDDATMLDTASLWVDPADFGNLGAPSATFSGNENDRVRPIADQGGIFKLNAVGDLGATITFDELRIGATSADVLPVVPEPSTVLMALIGLASLAAFRRR